MWIQSKPIFGGVKPISTYKTNAHTLVPNGFSRKQNKPWQNSQVNDVRSLLILFHMYDFEQNRSEKNHANSNMHSACVRF
jgi:hypothetical protein